MKVAIVGSGISGLSCALDLEKNKITPDIFEIQQVPGWIWPSVSFIPRVFYNEYGDTRQYLLQKYGIDVSPHGEIGEVTFKSANAQASVKGQLGHTFIRGNFTNSIENQLLRQLTYAAVRYNVNKDLAALTQQYDYVVVATGRDTEARTLGVWEDIDLITVVKAYILGSFCPDSSAIYFNTDYAGTCYGRLTPFNATSAILGLYIMGKDQNSAMQYFKDFIKKEHLEKNEIRFHIFPPAFTTGRVTQFRVGNILLTGRAAGLTERLLGCGLFEAVSSGVLAARAIMTGEDYEGLITPLKEHVENLSSIRTYVNRFTNDEFDKLVRIMGMPWVKQLVYNTNVSFYNMIGGLLKRFKTWSKPTDIP